MTSNVGQSYPYTSETEAQRAEAIAALISARPELESKIAEATTAPGEGERWWVWKCPTKDCPGLLHVAGYARDLHALFVACDGVCGRTFLR